MLTVILRKIGRRAQYEKAKKRDTHDSRGEASIIECPDSAEVALEYEFLISKLNHCDLEKVALLKLEGFTNDEIATKICRTRRTVQRMLELIREILREDFVD